MRVDRAKKKGKGAIKQEEHLPSHLIPRLNFRLLAAEIDGTIQKSCIESQGLSRAALGPQWQRVVSTWWTDDLFPIPAWNSLSQLCQPRTGSFEDMAPMTWTSVFGFCEFLQASVSSRYTRSMREGTQKLLCGGTTNRVMDSGETPFWGLPKRTEGRFKGPGNLFLRGILQ